MGVSGGVTASASGCGEGEGVKGNGDSAVKVHLSLRKVKRKKRLTGGIGWSCCGGEEMGGIIGGWHCERMWSMSIDPIENNPRKLTRGGWGWGFRPMSGGS